MDIYHPPINLNEPLPYTAIPFPLMVGIKAYEFTEVAPRFYDLDAAKNDLYQCPSGKKALIGPPSINNTSVGAATIAGYLKIGSDYYRVSADATVNAGNSTSSQGLTVGLVLSAGEWYSFETNVAGMNGSLFILEFDEDVPLHQARLLAPTLGYNEILSCPADKLYRITTVVAFSIGGLVGNGQIHAANFAGAGNLQIKVSLVEPSGTPSASNQIGGAAVTTNTTQTLIFATRILEEGESIHIYTPSGNAGQHYFINYWEEDA